MAPRNRPQKGLNGPGCKGDGQETSQFKANQIAVPTRGAEFSSGLRACHRGKRTSIVEITITRFFILFLAQVA